MKEEIDIGLRQCLNEWVASGGKMMRGSPPEHLLESERFWPLVEFATSGKRILCVPNDFVSESASGKLEAIRTQVRVPFYVCMYHFNALRGRFP